MVYGKARAERGHLQHRERIACLLVWRLRGWWMLRLLSVDQQFQLAPSCVVDESLSLPGKQHKMDSEQCEDMDVRGDDVGRAQQRQVDASNREAAPAPDTKLLFLSMKLHQNRPLPSDRLPYVTGSLDCLGAWDRSKAVPLELQTATSWELNFVLPAYHDTLEFKFLLKSKKDPNVSIVLESGPKRKLANRQTEKKASPHAFFELEGQDQLEFPVTVKATAVSPFALATSWKMQRENPRAPGLPDVISGISPAPPTITARGSQVLELDLHHYEVPTPAEGSPRTHKYVADAAGDPRNLSRSISVPEPGTRTRILGRLNGKESSNRCVSIKDLVVLGAAEEAQLEKSEMESALGKTTVVDAAADDSTGSHSTSGVDDSSMLDKPKSEGHSLNRLEETSVSEVEEAHQDMPQAAGAVAAGAVADRLLGPKERRQLAIVLVGLPARGKTFTAAKLTRYLRWLGHDTQHFNVGKYRRLKHGRNQEADFFRGDNHEGVDARNEVAVLAMEDMLSWMASGGQIGVFDATNSTNERRKLILRLAEDKCKVIFLETICNDQSVIETNIRLKIQQSPDYANAHTYVGGDTFVHHRYDYEAARADFKSRLANYERVYETVTEGSYIKMIDMVSDTKCQIQVSNMSGYLPGRIVFFLVNCHLTPRPILLTRHGESAHNVHGRIGGDSDLSESGDMYASKLADFVHKRLKNERTASIWTSTLQRSINTARHIAGFPKIQWRALDEINTGICDGMTYEEIKEEMPDEYLSRNLDKLRYRYPRGESYLDVIQRVEPVLIELERQRSPVVIIAHQAILRALYAYFADRPLKEIPQIPEQ